MEVPPPRSDPDSSEPQSNDQAASLKQMVLRPLLFPAAHLLPSSLDNPIRGDTRGKGESFAKRMRYATVLRIGTTLIGGVNRFFLHLEGVLPLAQSPLTPAVWCQQASPYSGQFEHHCLDQFRVGLLGKCLKRAAGPVKLGKPFGWF